MARLVSAVAEMHEQREVRSEGALEEARQQEERLQVRAAWRTRAGTRACTAAQELPLANHPRPETLNP